MLPVAYSDTLAIMLGYVGPFAGRVFGLCIAIGAMALGDNLETFGKFARLKTVAPSKSPMNVNPKIFLGALMCSHIYIWVLQCSS